MDKVNKKVIPIKLFGFLWHIGTHMVFPFMTIQMLQIGLNLQDVSIVYGITPLVTFLASPLSGKLLSFFGREHECSSFYTDVINEVFIDRRC